MIRFVLLLLISPALLAKDLGAMGQSFPVQERSFLSLIQNRLAQFGDDKSLQAIHNQWVKQVEEHAVRPKASVVTRASKTDVHYYTPVFIAQKTISDAHGRVIIAKGMRANALLNLPAYNPQWIFINEDDAAQVRFATKYLMDKPNAKLILTGGDVGRAEGHFDRAIYFDQEGRITRKLSINQVPATVKRVGDALHITEVAIKEDGDEI